MKEKTKLAQLKRVWQGQETALKIWKEGIIPYFIYQNDKFKPQSFTCYDLSKVLPFLSYQTIYKHLLYFEDKYKLKSDIYINENNRKERRFKVSDHLIRDDNYFSEKGKYYMGFMDSSYSLRKTNKVSAQIKYETLYYTKTPDRIYRLYKTNKINRNTFIQQLKYYIEYGKVDERSQYGSRDYYIIRMFHKCLMYIIEYSPKDKKLYKYLENIAVSNQYHWLRETALKYAHKFFPQYSEELQKHAIFNDKYLCVFETSKQDQEAIIRNNLLNILLNVGDTLKDYLEYDYNLSFDYELNGIVYKRRYYSRYYIPSGYGELRSWILIVNQDVDIFKDVLYRKIYASQERKKLKRVTYLGYRWFKIENYIIPMKHLYFAIKVLKEYKKFNDNDIKIALPHHNTPIKIFSEKSDIVIYLNYSTLKKDDNNTTRTFSYNTLARIGKEN